MGLVGDGGVHAHQEHLLALVELATREGVPRIAIHAELDGRDTMPTSALGYVERLERTIAGRAVIASVGGRYYGMDRDNRWPRIELWYRAAVDGTGPSATGAAAYIRDAYARGETDEFIKPAVIVRDGAAVAPMRDGDALICWNYRSDRMRQIVRALTVDGFDGFATGRRPALHVTTMTQYDATFALPVAFEPFSMARIVAEVLCDAGHDHPAHGGNGEVPARDLFLQRRGRDAVSRRGADPRAQPEGRDLRPDAGNERGGYHRCTLRARRGARARFHARQLRERRHGGTQRQPRRDDQGV